MKKQLNQWLLPEGISEIRPEQAAILESQRRLILDQFTSWGYELVMTPFVEYLDSLLVGTAKDLELQTFTLTDQLSGRLLGIRADITPQAARIDARQERQTPNRLCYIGSVLRTRNDGFGSSRSPLQVGAELYGHQGVESDVEVLRLMMETLNITGVSDFSIDLGHVGIFRGLTAQASLSEAQESALFDALQRKAIPEIDKLLADFDLDESVTSMLAALAHLNGGAEVIAEAKAKLSAATPEVLGAIDYVASVAEILSIYRPDVSVHFDLAELRAYHYQTGIVFAAFTPGLGQEIARGGRYDNIGEGYGRARPATGFSADLKTLMNIGTLAAPAVAEHVYAPWDNDETLAAKIMQLRSEGYIVVQALPGQTGGAGDMGCSQMLSNHSGSWQLQAV